MKKPTLIFLFLSLFHISSQANTWNISTAGNDANSGANGFPFATIQKGIDSAINGDTVLVQPGTYVENINFNGKNIVVGSLFITTQDTSYISSTVIDGNRSGCVVSFRNGEDDTAVLCGFTITNGYGDEGGGIRCENAHPRLLHLIITKNEAFMSGGGINLLGSNSFLSEIIVEGNKANDGGGGIFFWWGSNATLENVLINGNSSSSGGGIDICCDSNPIIKNSTITNNVASSYNGGGVYNRSIWLCSN